MDRGLVVQQGGHVGSLHGLREYRLVVYPDVPCYNRIMAEKQRFSRRFGVEAGSNQFPAIVVACFYAPEGLEETLIRWIQRICGLINNFSITLNNYSGLPDHTIYLRITECKPLRQLARLLKVIDEYICSSSGQAAWLCQHPYLALAEELPSAVYQAAMPVYSAKTFRASFPVNELVLLVRDHPFAIAKTVNVFRFAPAHRSVEPDMARYIASLQKESL